MMSARTFASHMDTHPNFSLTQLSEPGLRTPASCRATVSSLGSSNPAGAGWFPTITRGHGGSGWVAQTASTSTRARAAEVLIVPEGVGRSLHPTAPR
ncbi:hypothetical protein, partial [Mycobacteroides abscessus]|uniref:hypothetical protein n=1 Tax=Mycobacteroides abscessus TaxID=36809 RepID=UPI0019D0188D